MKRLNRKSVLHFLLVPSVLVLLSSCGGGTSSTSPSSGSSPQPGPQPAPLPAPPLPPSTSDVTYSIGTISDGSTLSLSNNTNQTINLDSLEFYAAPGLPSIGISVTAPDKACYNPTLTQTKNTRGYLIQYSVSCPQSSYGVKNISLAPNSKDQVTLKLGNAKVGPNIKYGKAKQNLAQFFLPQFISVSYDNTSGLIGPDTVATTGNPDATHMIGAYFADWTIYGPHGSYSASDIPFQYLNTIFYSIGGFDPTGQEVGFSHSNADPKEMPILYYASQEYPWMNLVYSFGS